MTKKEKIILIILAAAVLLMTLFVFSNSLKSREASGADSGAVAKIVEPIFDAVFGEGHGIDVHLVVRKAAHLTEFCILGILVLNLSRAISRKLGRELFGYCLFYVLLVAVLDEFIQFHSGRGSMVSDVLIDLCGALIGLFATLAVIKIRERIKLRKKG